ncbi:MAG: hypothetical protein KIT58_03950 [Planctomycetota bacterium]|nr:hypothetical protein [Planctomycetota bacterium]
MIAVDTMIVVWGLRGAPVNPADETRGMVARAQAFFEGLDPSKERVVVPAPVLAEALVPVADDPRGMRFYSELLQTLIVGQFDARAAVLAARVANRNMVQARVAAAAIGGSSRQQLRVDALVLGVALAQGCRSIVTDNVAEMQKLADGFPIRVSELPPAPDRQEFLFSPIR